MVLTQAFLQSLLEGTSVDLPQTSGANGVFYGSMAINDFLFSLNIDNINLVKLVQYIKESNIIHKVSSSIYVCDNVPYNFFLLALFLFLR